MSEYKLERRRYKRVFFPNQDESASILKFCDGHEEFLTVIVKDLSEGGLGFAVKRNNIDNLITGTQLAIKKIQGSDNLGFLTDLKLEVIWVLDCDEFEHVGFGCRFLDVPQALREKIRNYVEAWISEGIRL